MKNIMEQLSLIHIEMCIRDRAFIRTENGTSYVYKDVKGTLKKQQITVGSIVNSGYYAVVTSGLKSDDLLAFPYGCLLYTSQQQEH